MSALQRAVLARMLDVVLALLAERGITDADLLAALRESWLLRPRSWSPMRSAG